MPSLISYVMDVCGTEFCSKIQIQKTSDMIGDLEEFVLRDFGIDFFATTDGSVTHSKLAIPYGCLYDRKAYDSQNVVIAKWEQHICTLFNGRLMIRLDDFLLSEWRAKTNYTFIFDPTSIVQLRSWLDSQDSDHWSLLTCDP